MHPSHVATILRQFGEKQFKKNRSLLKRILFYYKMAENIVGKTSKCSRL
jgi:hypothetical protein